MSPPPPEGTDAYEAWAQEDKGPAIMTLCWTFIALATFFMICRLYVRIGIFQKLRSDDYWCLAGLVCGIISTSMTMAAVDNGNGRHYQTLSIAQQENVRLWTTLAFCPGVLSFGLPKLAVVSLLTRLLNPSRQHTRFLWGMTLWCLLTLVATIGTLLGQCTPTKAMWNFDMDKTCVDPKHIVNFSLYAGALSAFVDLYLAIYPAVVLYKLQMKLRKKLALTAALGIGALGGGVAIYKTTQIPSGLNSPDFSYDSSELVNWTIIEGATIIIAATIPVLSPLMDKLFRGRNPFSSSRKTDASKNLCYCDCSDRSGTGPHAETCSSSKSPRLRHPLDPLDPSRDLEMPVITNSSQENLTPFGDREKQPVDDVESGGSTLGSQHCKSSAGEQSGDSRRLQRQPSQQVIVQTHEVMVTYDMRENQERLYRTMPWETPEQAHQWPLR